MLVLTRKPGEKLVIADNIRVVVLEVNGNAIKLGIEAPRTVRVLRAELVKQIDAKQVADPDLQNKPAEWMKPADAAPCRRRVKMLRSPRLRRR